MNGTPEVQMSEDAQPVSPIIGIEKKCATCQKIKLLSNFSPSKKAKDKKQYRCKQCQAKAKRSWQKLNPKKAGEWAKLNPEKARVINAKSKTKKRSTLKGKLAHCISTNIRLSLRGNKKGRSWETLVGYTVNQLKKHLEKLFKDGMSWSNYGKGGWEIDHKIPINMFNYTKPEHRDFQRCWALKNLQPLWAKDNVVKSNKIISHFQPSLLM